MAPRPPAPRPRTRRPAPVKRMMEEVAAGLTAAGATVNARPRSRGPVFSPYPDLSMAIAMLEKRAAQLASNGANSERVKLVTKWLESLQQIHNEMQKLHKLEILANRLTSSSETEA